jgi:hypothetical protein
MVFPKQFHGPAGELCPAVVGSAFICGCFSLLRLSAAICGLYEDGEKD